MLWFLLIQSLRAVYPQSQVIFINPVSILQFPTMCKQYSENRHNSCPCWSKTTEMCPVITKPEATNHLFFFYMKNRLSLELMEHTDFASFLFSFTIVNFFSLFQIFNSTTTSKRYIAAVRFFLIFLSELYIPIRAVENRGERELWAIFCSLSEILFNS